MCGHNSSFVHGLGVNIANTDLPVAGPSRHHEQDPQASSGIEGDALKLTVSPRHGPSVSFVISPVQTRTQGTAGHQDSQAGDKEGADDPICSQWSVTSHSPQQ